MKTKNSNHYKKMAKLMTRLVNHQDFSILTGQVDNWVKETRSKLTPEQLRKLDTMTGKIMGTKK